VLPYRQMKRGMMCTGLSASNAGRVTDVSRR
jgi:hypothetical protein